MKKMILTVSLALSVLVWGRFAHADLLKVYDETFTVEAYSHSYNAPLATQFSILPGDVLAFSASLSDTWNLFDANPDYESNADGLTSETLVENDGIPFYPGLLVGKIGDGGSYFQIGTSLTVTSADSGNLYLLCWDKFTPNNRYVNNSGAIDVAVRVQREAPVPEPTTIFLFGAGLAMLAGVRRRREK